MTAEHASLSGRQRRYLRGLAHDLEPVVHIGKGGLTETVIASIEEALQSHELIKIRFLDFKDRKNDVCDEIRSRLGAQLAGTVGHVAILYRPATTAERRRIHLP